MVEILKKQSHADVWVISVWTLLMALCAYFRQDFCGDGLRHLPAILTSPYPGLGEPRWIFFPATLFAILKPLMALGLVTDMESAVKPFLTVNVLSGLAYLIFLRVLLIAKAVPMNSRAAGLALAAVSTPLMVMTQDINEPMIAAVFAMAGLAYASTREPSPVNLVLAAAFIVVGSLIYQAVALSVLFLPALIPGRVLLRPKIFFSACAMLSLIPLTMTLAIMMERDYSLAHSLKATFFAYEDILSANYLRKPFWIGIPVALLAGLPQQIIYIPGYAGLQALFSSFSEPSTRFRGIYQILILSAGLAFLGSILTACLKRKDWPLLLGLGAVLLLPFVRYHQYTYIKLYVLLPVFLALTASKMKTSRVIFMATLVFFLNGSTLFTHIMDGRRIYADFTPLYQKMGSNACWMAIGHLAPVSQTWKGKTCGIMQIIGEGKGEENFDLLLKKEHDALVACTEDCFCNATEVLTQDMIPERKSDIVFMTDYYKFQRFNIVKLLWDSQKGKTLFENSPNKTFVYSQEQQQAICRSVKEAKTNEAA